MELEFGYRNNDLGPHFPTFQERVNAMLPAQAQESAALAQSAAPELPAASELPLTPHMPTNEEVQMTLAQVEQEALEQSQQLIDMHSGLNEQRVARLLGLLE